MSPIKLQDKNTRRVIDVIEPGKRRNAVTADGRFVVLYSQEEGFFIGKDADHDAELFEPGQTLELQNEVIAVATSIERK